MIGRKFGSWTVLEEVERDKWGKRTYLSRCSCGTERGVDGSSLRTGKSTSCGCARKVLTDKKTYGRWEVIAEVNENKHGQRMFSCVCECGTRKNVKGTALRTGTSKSCGCLQKEMAAERITTHGYSKSKLYNTWYAMLRRCDDPTDESYENYGGRGITYDPRYSDFMEFHKDHFEGFEKHVTEYGEAQTTLDRIDNDGDYVKSNLRWTDWSTQARNRRVRTDSVSGVTGVCWHKDTGKWYASIFVNNKQIHLGSFTDFNLAVEAREDAEIKYWNTESIT